MANEAPGQTLQPTALVHEAWMRLVGNKPVRFENRAHFFAAAAEAMRRILIENTRCKSRQKRVGQWERIDLESIHLATESDPATLLGIDEEKTPFLCPGFGFAHCLLRRALSPFSLPL